MWVAFAGLCAVTAFVAGLSVVGVVPIPVEASLVAVLSCVVIAVSLSVRG